MSRRGGSLPLRSNLALSPRRTIAGQSLGEFGPLTNSGTFPVKDINGDRDKECKTSKNSSGPFEVIFVADVLIDCVGRVSVDGGRLKRFAIQRKYSQGTAYIAATPARKSRASALPPVAEAEYGP